jgi:hypothetical protein
LKHQHGQSAPRPRGRSRSARAAARSSRSMASARASQPAGAISQARPIAKAACGTASSAGSRASARAGEPGSRPCQCGDDHTASAASARPVLVSAVNSDSAAPRRSCRVGQQALPGRRHRCRFAPVPAAAPAQQRQREQQHPPAPDTAADANRQCCETVRRQRPLAAALTPWRRSHSFSSGSTQLPCGSGQAGAGCAAPGTGRLALRQRPRCGGGSLSSASTVGSPQWRMSALRACASGDSRKSATTCAALFGAGVERDGQEVRVADGAAAELPALHRGRQALGGDLVGGLVGVEAQRYRSARHRPPSGASPWGWPGTAAPHATAAGAAHPAHATAARSAAAKRLRCRGRASAARSG